MKKIFFVLEVLQLPVSTHTNINLILYFSDLLYPTATKQRACAAENKDYKECVRAAENKDYKKVALQKTKITKRLCCRKQRLQKGYTAENKDYKNIVLQKTKISKSAHVLQKTKTYKERVQQKVQIIVGTVTCEEGRPSY